MANTIIFVGHARLPQAFVTQSPLVSVEVEVDPDSGEILNASCAPVPALGAALIRDLLIGRNISEGLDAPAAEVQRRYLCPTQRAPATAIANTYETYVRWKTAADPAQGARRAAEMPPENES